MVEKNINSDIIEIIDSSDEDEAKITMKPKKMAYFHSVDENPRMRTFRASDANADADNKSNDDVLTVNLDDSDDEVHIEMDLETDIKPNRIEQDGPVRTFRAWNIDMPLLQDSHDCKNSFNKN